MRIEIAGYVIGPYPQPPLPGGLPDPNQEYWVWIENQEGEGMGMPMKKFNAEIKKHMDQYWKENF